MDKKKINLIRGDGQFVNMANHFKGESLFILACGPSLKTYDLSLLNGKHTLGINFSPLVYKPEMWIATDRPSGYPESIWSDDAILKFCPDWNKYHYLNINNGQEMKVSDVPNTLFFNLQSSFRPDYWLHQNKFVWGNLDSEVDSLGVKGIRSTFMVAIKMAWYLGFRNVFLLGADFNSNQESSYCIDGMFNTEAVIKKNMSSYEAMNIRLSYLAPQLEAEGMNIFNCNPESGLTAFDYLSYHDAIDVTS
jgi:hypothetical protein